MRMKRIPLISIHRFVVGEMQAFGYTMFLLFCVLLYTQTHALPSFTTFPNGFVNYTNYSFGNLEPGGIVTNYSVRRNQVVTFTCAATGNGVVTVCVQLSLCGAPFTCMNTSNNNVSWTTTITDGYNCARIRCQGTDADDIAFSPNANIMVLFDSGARINCSCGLMCGLTVVNMTSSGNITFDDYFPTRAGPSMIIWRNQFNLTVNGSMYVQNFRSSPTWFSTSGPCPTNTPTFIISQTINCVDQFFYAGNFQFLMSTFIAGLGGITLLGSGTAFASSSFTTTGPISIGGCSP